VNFNINWAAQEVSFPRFGLQLREDQSADDFMTEVENKVNAMIGKYTMNEYKAYKNLVKRKKRINQVFSEICGDKSFRSRRPGCKMKMPVVAVARCSAVPLKAPRRRSEICVAGLIELPTTEGRTVEKVAMMVVVAEIAALQLDLAENS
jgi:hypothetical protein